MSAAPLSCIASSPASGWQPDRQGRSRKFGGRQMAAQVVIAGAGLTGATLARRLAEAGHRVTVHDQRDHLAGNCHTSLDAATGVMVHRYGPHIFHTADAGVRGFLERFTRFIPYRHRVVTRAGGRIFSMPINLLTINAFFGTAMGPEEARAHIAAQAVALPHPPRNFEEQALALMGRPLYETFFKGYTEKQWGVAATELPAEILARLPFRFTYDDSYFQHPFQAMPDEGYSAMVAAMLDHPSIDIHLNSALPAGQGGDHLVWTGPIDLYFGHRLGRLAYRTLDFTEIRAPDDRQGTPVINEADASVPYTRTTEHRHFSPWREVSGSVLYREAARDCGPGDIPYYPVRLLREKEMLAGYEALAAQEKGVSFAGRLGQYRYLDMDQAVRAALDLSDRLISALAPRRAASARAGR
jgi:UDP-galactopyranose mutase